MTRDEILNMPAGREMDALVAEKVMGWSNRWYNNNPNSGVSFWYDEKNETPAGWLNFDCPNDYNGDVFSPSDNIAAAWEVAEKIVTYPVLGKWKGDYHRMSLTYSPRRNVCNFQYHGMTISATAETAPLAICRAALLAVMEAG